MTREERCKLAIEKGYTYDSETGLIKNKFGNKLQAKTSNGYVIFGVKINKKTFQIRAHQFAFYFVYGYCPEEIDHINGVRIDNRLCNLRPVTRQQNQWNRNTAKGYYFHKTNKKYHAQIYLNTKRIYLGLYSTEQEARAAYLEAKEKYHKIEEI